MDLIKAVRTLRADMGVHPAKRTSLIIETADKTPFEQLHPIPEHKIP